MATATGSRATRCCRWPGGASRSYLFAAEAGPPVTEAQRKLLREMAELSVDTTTPLEALNLLYRWKRETA